MKAVKRIGILLVSFFMLSLSFSCAPGAQSGEESILVRLEPGSSASAAARILADAGIIRSPRLFLALVKLSGKDQKIQAGSYLLARGSSAFTVMDALVNGDVARKRMTIPEGSTSQAIARLLEEGGLVPAKVFLEAIADPKLAAELGLPGGSLDGYLYPDTYEFDLGSTASSIATIMAKRFLTEIERLSPGIVSKPAYLRERIILASIVEREYRIGSEAPIIASVFDNRLKIGMALQSCATVVYALTERLGRPYPERVSYEDLKIADPYNTYRQRGLPPGPISNPGSLALRAVLDHPKTEYLYFRVEDESIGSHRFSRDFEEHRGGIPVKGR